MSSLKDFMSSKDDGVFVIGHSSALSRLDGFLYLVDPVWGDYKPYENFVFWPRQVDCYDILQQVSGVIVTHEHQDHWSPEILKQLECPVYLMAGRPHIKDTISKYAKIVEEIQPYTWTQLRGGADVFFSEHSFNKIDSLPFLRGKHSCFSFGSDCFLDEKKINEIKRAIPQIDVSLVPWAFIHFWPFLQTDISEEFRNQEINRMVKQSEEQAKLFVDAFNPKIAIGTGADLYYDTAPSDILNRHLIAGVYPSFLEHAIAGSYVINGKLVSGEHKEPFPAHASAPLDLATYEIIPEWHQLLRKKTSLVDAPIIHGYEIIVNQTVIDLQTKNVFHRQEWGNKPYYRFNFDKPIYLDWLNGKRTLENCIGTRRFEFCRNPDVYRKDLFAHFQEYL